MPLIMVFPKKLFIFVFTIVVITSCVKEPKQCPLMYKLAPSTYDVNLMSETCLLLSTLQSISHCDIPDIFSVTILDTAVLASDLDLIYNQIQALTITNPSHALAFGAGETLNPGVYHVTGAMSLSGILTLDGLSTTDPFVFITDAAFAAATAADVVLTNGALPSNVFWLAEGAISVGAGSNISGTMFSNTAAIAIATGCLITGRLLTKGGAVSLSTGILSYPTDPTFINFHGLDAFVMFTGLGAVSNAGSSTYTGNIATNGGAITGFTVAGCVLNGVIFQAGSTQVLTPVVILPVTIQVIRDKLNNGQVGVVDEASFVQFLNRLYSLDLDRSALTSGEISVLNTIFEYLNPPASLSCCGGVLYPTTVGDFDLALTVRLGTTSSEREVVVSLNSLFSCDIFDVECDVIKIDPLSGTPIPSTFVLNKLGCVGGSQTFKYLWLGFTFDPAGEIYDFKFTFRDSTGTTLSLVTKTVTF
jgi:hypothetical protein